MVKLEGRSWCTESALLNSGQSKGSIVKVIKSWIECDSTVCAVWKVFQFFFLIVSVFMLYWGNDNLEQISWILMLPFPISCATRLSLSLFLYKFCPSFPVNIL